jgi:cation diffusion facilitator family transporter
MKMKDKIAKLSILVNLILAGAKIAVGFVSRSSSILAEGVHSFMDIFSSVIGYLGIKASKKPADERHPYGHFKFEVLAGAVITLILFATGSAIIYDVYKNFLNPVKIEFTYLGFLVMIFSAVVNEIMSRIKLYIGKKENSIALISDGFHSRIDVFTSLAVFAGLFLIKYWIFIDSVLAFLIGLYIIKQSFSLGKEAVDSLLDVSASSEIEEKLRSIVRERGIEIDSLRTQKKGSALTANLEIQLPSNLKIEEATKISESLREELMKEIENLSYVAIQIRSHEIETGFYRPAFGKGLGWQRREKFKKEFEKAEGKGPGGWCVCPKCGYEKSHQQGVPCLTLQCPKCKSNLERR